MTVRTATGLLTLIENQLGCIPENPKGLPHWKVQNNWAGRLNKARARNLRKYTWHNLELAVAYLARQHIEIRSPIAVFFYVDKAIEAGNPEQPQDKTLDELIEEAITQENTHHLPGWIDWRDRLVRAFGPARVNVYAEWVKARKALTP